MSNRKDHLQAGVHRLRPHWLLLTLAAVAIVLLPAGRSLFAADAQPAINQTVPPATPRPEVPPPSDDDDSNDDNSQDSSTPTAAEAATAAAETAVAQAAAGQTGVVNVLALNVRQGPSTSFPVIGKLAQGVTVTVEARNTAGDWWLVCCLAGTDTRGWVSASFVSPDFGAEETAALPVSDSAVEATPVLTTTVAATTAATATATVGVTAAATPVPGSLPGTVAGVNLNVRSGPTTDSDVIAKLRADDVVSVLGRNAGGDWLYICCVGSPAVNGWVSAAFITPAFTSAELDEVTDSAAATDAQASATPEAAAENAAEGETAADAAADAAALGLSLAIVQQPPFAVQGKEIALVYTVRNGGSADLADVVLSSELPAPLTLVAATAAGGAVTQDQAPLIEITWPVLAAGESATATVRVRVAEDVPNGTTFANLATVTAGAESAGSGITIGMPPSLLPDFW